MQMKPESRLLFDEHPLVVSPKAAEVLGLHEAIILQQIHYWLQDKTNDKVLDGRKWTYNSYSQWQEQFPFLSVDQIRRAINSLEKLGILIASNYNKLKIDRTKWYTIDYKKLESIQFLRIGTSARPVGTEASSNGTSARPLPETTTETSKKNTAPQNGAVLPLVEKKQQPTVEGQFANKAYRHYCDEIYPQEHNGDKYAGEGKQDVPYLTRLVKVTKCQDSREWAKRLRNYAQSTSKFHIDNGHRILDFKWNAWSDSMMEKRQSPAAGGETETPMYLRGKQSV
jgi:hypothetical protein